MSTERVRSERVLQIQVSLFTVINTIVSTVISKDLDPFLNIDQNLFQFLLDLGPFCEAHGIPISDLHVFVLMS